MPGKGRIPVSFKLRSQTAPTRRPDYGMSRRPQSACQHQNVDLMLWWVRRRLERALAAALIRNAAARTIVLTSGDSVGG